MNLSDIAKVTHTIKRLDITARTPRQQYIHRYIFGENISVTRYMRYDITSGKLTIVEKNINYHGTPTRRGPEMGWGLIESEIPKELLKAEISTLGMNCRDGVSYSVTVDVILLKKVDIADDEDTESADDELRLF